MILRQGMNKRKDDLRLTKRSLFSREQQLQHRSPPLIANLGKNENDLQSKSNKKCLISGSASKMDLIVKRIRSSLTPAKKYDQPRFLSPKYSLVSNFFTGNLNYQQNAAETSPFQNLNEYSGSTDDFVKKPEEMAPLVFIKGEFEINQILKQSSTPQNEQEEHDFKIQILIPKLINYSEQAYSPGELCLYILGVKLPVSKEQLNIRSGQYVKILKAPIYNRIKSTSVHKSITVEANQVDKRAILKMINLVIVLKDESKGQILYWCNYLNPEKLVSQLKKKQHYKKIEELY